MTMVKNRVTKQFRSRRPIARYREVTTDDSAAGGRTQIIYPWWIGVGLRYSDPGVMVRLKENAVAARPRAQYLPSKLLAPREAEPAYVSRRDAALQPASP